MGKVAQQAINHWRGILKELGVDEKILNGKHQACPRCGGADRFRFDDKEGRGDHFCSQCGAGDGFGLLEKVFGWDFATAAKEVEAVLGIVEEDKPTPKPDHKARLQHIQSELVAVTPVSQVGSYLKSRGVKSIPKTLKMHPKMRYYRSRDEFVTYPAMVAKIHDSAGNPVGYHVTYLQLGQKAPETSPRKIIGELGEQGYAVRLFKPKHHLGVAEGLETAIAAKNLSGIPVWAVLNTNGMRDFVPPEGVTTVTIFADNDSNFAGQAAAYALARKLTIKRYKVRVIVPEKPDTDFLDVLIAQK